MMTVQDLFAIGMKRMLPDLLPFEEPMLELGPGASPISETSFKLDLPEWNGERQNIPFKDSVLRSIVAFHFFEHFSGADVVSLLRECERVLMPGGVLTVVVPHRLGSMAFQDLDHKSFWTEDTWKELFGNPFYQKNRESPWKFSVNFNVIIGIVERNLCLMTQLVKEEG